VALSPDQFNLVSILKFRRMKDDFTYNKSAEHTEISKFVLYVAETSADENWKKAASALNKDGMLKRQSQWEEVKLFWNIVENEKANLDEYLLKKKLEQIKTQFAVDRYVSGNEALMIADKAKLGHMLALDFSNVLTTSSSGTSLTSLTTLPPGNDLTTPPPGNNLTTSPPGDDPAMPQSDISLTTPSHGNDPTMPQSDISLTMASPVNDPAMPPSDISLTTPPPGDDPAMSQSDISHTTPSPGNDPAMPQSDLSLTMPSPGNDPAMPPSDISLTTSPPGNDPATPPPSMQYIIKRPQPLLDIYDMDLDWAPWEFDAIIDTIDIEQVLLDLYKQCQKARPKMKTSLDCGIIDLNDGVILEALGESIKMYFEEKIQIYKPRKVISEDVAKTLRKFNVTSLEDLGNVLSEVKIDYNNLDRDIVYVHRLFQKFYLLFQNNGSLNLNSFELQEGWYNSNIVAPIFDDCLESVDEWILRRGEVESYAQKCLDRRTRKKKKYDGILSFSRQFEFIYIETATTSILSKTEEKLLEEISSMPVLCVQFNGANTEIYLANWAKNMRPIVFSIMEFDIPEEVTALPKLTKVAAKMLSLRSFIIDLNKKYQALLKKAASYYLDEDNVWNSPLKLKVRR
ncbi:8204_t:CDS:2, partial [Gigaspora margarita]